MGEAETQSGLDRINRIARIVGAQICSLLPQLTRTPLGVSKSVCWKRRKCDFMNFSFEKVVEVKTFLDE